MAVGAVVLTQTVGAEHAQNENTRANRKGMRLLSGRRQKGTSYVSFCGVSGQSYSSKLYSSTEGHNVFNIEKDGSLESVCTSILVCQ